MLIIEIAIVCHEANRAYCNVLGDYSQLAWSEAPDWQRDSAIKGVQYRLDNPNSKPSDSHNSWLAEKQAAGWKYATIKDASRKVHPCCVPYESLPPTQQAKDALFIGIVDALRSLLDPTVLD